MWLLLLCLVEALRPVADFRVPLLAPAARSAARLLYRAVDASPVPVLEASSAVQLLWTDASNSIYYLNTTLNVRNYLDVFPLLLDTGTGTTWVASSACNAAGCSKSARFAADVQTLGTFAFAYSGSAVEGAMASPALDLVVSLPHGLRASNYSFGLADSVPPFFDNYTLSGIVGVQALAQHPTTNLVHQLAQQHAIDALQFGLVLGSPRNMNSTAGGALVFGSAANRTALALGPVAYCSIVENPQNYWMVKIQAVSVGSGTFNSSVNAIVDTGTTGMALPLADANEFHQAVFGEHHYTDNLGNYAIPCNASGSVQFLIDNHNLTFGTENIVAGPYSGDLAGFCASKVQGIDTGSWVLGASFLKNFYTVFDLENRRIGFAPRAKSYALVEPVHNHTLTQTLALALALALATPTESHSRGGAGHLRVPWVFSALAALR